jgi:hypothetical protein
LYKAKYIRIITTAFPRCLVRANSQIDHHHPWPVLSALA